MLNYLYFACSLLTIKLTYLTHNAVISTIEEHACLDFSDLGHCFDIDDDDLQSTLMGSDVGVVVHPVDISRIILLPGKGGCDMRTVLLAN